MSSRRSFTSRALALLPQLTRPENRTSLRSRKILTRISVNIVKTLLDLRLLAGIRIKDFTLSTAGPEDDDLEGTITFCTVRDLHHQNWKPEWGTWPDGSEGHNGAFILQAELIVVGPIIRALLDTDDVDRESMQRVLSIIGHKMQSDWEITRASRLTGRAFAGSYNFDLSFEPIEGSEDPDDGVEDWQASASSFIFRIRVDQLPQFPIIVANFNIMKGLIEASQLNQAWNQDFHINWYPDISPRDSFVLVREDAREMD